jgi:16S rRNA (guanine527-N7)-methyltransferase
MSREAPGVRRFDRAAVLSRFDVSRETSARLDALVATLTRWSAAINLVSRATLPEVWHRHVADSAQLFDLAPSSAHSWVDLGAGAGFPGLVIAAFAADRHPDLHVTLVESDTRKVAFMAEAARAMGVTVTLRPVRIEALGPERFDVVSARALAPLATLLPMARRLLAPGGTLLFPKGAEADSELAALPALDREGVERLASITSPDATILRWSARDG